jgi:hypothetical protein
MIVPTILNRAHLALPRVNLTFELRLVAVGLSMTREASFRPSIVRPGYGPVSVGILHLNCFGVATHEKQSLVTGLVLTESIPVSSPAATRFLTILYSAGIPW